MRRSVYLAALGLAVSTFVLSMISIFQINWIVVSTPSSSPVSFREAYGLFRVCSSSTWGDEVCRKFPSRTRDCDAVDASSLVSAFQKRKRLGANDDGWTFCDSWTTAGYAAQLAQVFGATAILASLTVSLSGRAKRERGWRVVTGLLGLHGACLCVAMALVAAEYNNNERFYFGARYGTGFILATIAWSVDAVVVLGLVGLGLFKLAKEDDYERIAD